MHGGGKESERAATMKLSVFIVVALLSGCAGLNVSWAAAASYNALVMTVTQMVQGFEEQKKQPAQEALKEVP